MTWITLGEKELVMDSTICRSATGRCGFLRGWRSGRRTWVLGLPWAPRQRLVRRGFRPSALRVARACGLVIDDPPAPTELRCSGCNCAPWARVRPDHARKRDRPESTVASASVWVCV